MSKRTRELSPEEKDLWRRVASSLKPHRHAGEREEISTTAKVKRAPRATAPAPPARLGAGGGSPADRGAERRVRRGKIEPGATLDLHGHTQASGRAALARFIRSAQARGDRVVIVVTGQGRAGDGILKRRLPEWLAERDLRPLTSGLAQAHRAHGGAGAFYVFIKRAR